MLKLTVFLLVSGMAAARCIEFNFWPVYVCACLLFLLYVAFNKTPRSIFLAWGVVFFTGALLFKNTQTLSSCDITNFTGGRGKRYIVKGTVSDDPERDGERLSFLCKVREASCGKTKFSCCGILRVSLDTPAQLAYADEVVLRGSIYPVTFRNNSYDNNYYRYLRNCGVSAIMHNPSADEPLISRIPAGFNILRLSYKIKQNIQDRLHMYSSGLTAAILDAMVLGDKKNIPFTVKSMMIKSGTIHILVVSGFNVGIVAFAVMVALKMLRIPRRARYFIACAILVFYCFITGSSPPVLRATIMMVICIIAYFFRTQADIKNSLLIAALFLLANNPRSLFDLSFQLSFVCVFAIAYVFPVLKRALAADKLKNKAAVFICDSALVSLSCWLSTAGFIAYHFKIISPVTVLANIIAVPIASFVTLSGFSMAVIGFVFPAILPFISRTTEAAIIIFLFIIKFLVSLPGACFSW